MAALPPLRLGVNVDHVATVRNARGGRYPDPLRAAQIAIAAGADGITAHLREDRRHIRDDDMARLKAAIRESDLAARLGGDEFALILVNTGLEAAQVLAHKLMESLSLPYAVGALGLEISASIGIACYPDSGTALEALSLRADEAMYKAKAEGKRRYAIAS